jgi:NAD(P)-dependent dehydrogenase (short-subunit alcohol dehydrogenase family)
MLQVNNAGILPKDWTAQAFEQCIATNVVGPIQLSQQLLPHMAKGSAVVMVSSGGALAWIPR